MKTKLTIRNCESTFRFQCPKTWSELSLTATADVRHCGVCDCDVFFRKMKWHLKNVVAYKNGFVELSYRRQSIESWLKAVTSGGLP
jgi:hypothetical protein